MKPIIIAAGAVATGAVVTVHCIQKGVKNNTKDYIALRLENKNKSLNLYTVLLAPGEKIGGAFDGAILQNGTIIKVSAHAPFFVNFEVNEDEKGAISFKIKDAISWVINKAGDAYKEYENRNSNTNYKFSKIYYNQNQKNAELYEWWKITVGEVGEPDGWDSRYVSDERQKEIRDYLNKL